MNLELFDYELPKKLISQKLILPRDRCKLLVYDRSDKSIKHQKFFDIEKYLTSDDALVLNNTKVFPSRLIGEKETGGKIEIFLLNPVNQDFSVKVSNRWNILVNKKVSNSKIVFKKNKKIILTGMIKKDVDSIVIKFDTEGKKL